MQYRVLGKSGLQVSTISLGTATFGVRPRAEEVDDLVRSALELGINSFDCANSYGNRPHFDQPGVPAAAERKSAEELLGTALKGHRAEVVIATKVDEPIGPGPNERGLSRVHVMQQVESSLRRLQTDYIDVYYAHHRDRNTPIETMVHVFDELVQQGKIRYYALSQFTAADLLETLWSAERLGCNEPICDQVSYSLANRSADSELLPTCSRYGVSLVSFSPLAGGLLGGTVSASRDLTGNARWGGPGYTDEQLSFAKRFEQLALSWMVSPAELALAWILSHEEVASAVVGASTADGLLLDAKGADLVLDNAQLAELDTLVS